MKFCLDFLWHALAYEPKNLGFKGYGNVSGVIVHCDLRLFQRCLWVWF